MNINAPMPGKIISIKVKVGDSVKKDQELLMMESLKMENAIRTRNDGVVKEIFVKAGDQVQTGNPLVSVE
jgi:biotin carboxyl carrier protein